MENKFKRFLSLLLALVMVIGMLPAGIVRAEAAEGGTTSPAYTKEVDGYVRVWGEGGSFSKGVQSVVHADDTATLSITGGTFDQDPSAYVASGYEATETNGTYTVAEAAVRATTWKVATKEQLDAAIADAVEGDTILLTADIDYGANILKIEKAITLDLGGYGLTTSNGYGGMWLKNGSSIKNGTYNHNGNTAAIKVWNAVSIENLVINVGFTTEGKVKGGIVIQENSVGVQTIKNVTIQGEGLTNGIETYNCGNATEPVIGSMENVTINAVGTGMLISAPCGTATGCSISGGTNGIEIWIKGTYSASLDLVDCDVTGGEQAVYAHDEFKEGVVNNGTLSLTADSDTGLTTDDVTLALVRDNESVEGLLKEAKEAGVAKVGYTYYGTLAEALAEAADNATIELISGENVISMAGAVYGKTVTITGTAVADWNQGYLFVGRGGEGNGKLIFDNATITSASNSSSYGIHVSGREKENTNKYDGTLEIKNSNIELDYLIDRGTIVVDNSTLTVKNGFGIAGRPASETESGEAATATITIQNGCIVTVKNHNGMGVGTASATPEGYGVLNLVDSIFECDGFNVTNGLGKFNVSGTSVINLNGKTFTGSILAPEANLTVKNGTIVNTDKSVSALEINAGTLTLTDVNINSARHAVRIDGAVIATINGGTYKAAIGEGTGTYHAVNVSGAATVTIKDGTFVGPKGTTADSGSAVNVQSGAAVTIEGGDFSGGKNNTLAADGNLTVTGGTFDQDPSAYVASGYEATETDGTYTVAEAAEETLTGSIRLTNATLNLLDKVCIVYKTADDQVTTKSEDVAERGVLLYDSSEKAATKDPDQAYENVQLVWNAEAQKYIGQSEGIDARDMAKSQFAVAYLKMEDGTYIFGTKDGEEQIVEYSPLIYCRLMKEDSQVGTLCRAMMHYGAAAQVEQYGMTSGLMNEGFEAVPYDEDVLGETVFSADTAITNGMRLRSVTMDLKGAISYIVKFTVEDQSISNKQLYAEYTLLGETGSVELVPGEDGRLWATISGVPAKDLGKTLKVKAYYLDDNGDKVYGGELVFSGYEYVRIATTNASYTEEVKALAKALAMYIYYANAYGN